MTSLYNVTGTLDYIYIILLQNLFILLFFMLEQGHRCRHREITEILGKLLNLLKSLFVICYMYNIIPINQYAHLSLHFRRIQRVTLFVT